MSKKTLIKTNSHLNNSKIADKMRIRSIASSTAIETQESIEAIEAKLNHKRPARYHVILA